MPRTVEMDLDSDESEDEGEQQNVYNINVKESKKPLLATSWGSDQWYEMSKATNKELTCSICLESCLDCKNCLALLVPCLHAVHYRCLFQMEKPECPICRPSNKS